MADATYDPGSLPRDLPPQPIGVYRWSPTGGPGGAPLFEPLPHVAFESCSYYEGPRPPDCLLRYVVDPYRSPLSEFEALLPMGAPHPLALKQGDRVAVTTLAVDGTVRYLFDGYVTMPGLGLSPREARVPIRLLGAAARLWDQILITRPQRDARPGELVAIRLVDTWLPIRFNPDGHPNCADAPEDVSESDYPYPVFIDERAPAEAVRMWSLDRAIRFILGRGNPDQLLIKNPPVDELERSLRAAVPVSPGIPIDPDDPATYTLEEVPAPDRVVGDLPLPEAISAVLAGRGFAWKFALRTVGGLPEHYIRFYPVRDPLPGSERVLRLQPAGQSLDPAWSNLTEAQLQRDSTQMVNVWRARIAPLRVEACFLLMPAFDPDPADAGEEVIETFRKTNGGGGESDRWYRRWRFGESGRPWNDGESDTYVIDGPDAFVDLRAELGVGRWSARDRPALPERPPAEPGGPALRPRLGILVGSEDPAGGDDGVAHGRLARPRVCTPADLADVHWVKGGWRLADDELAVVIDVDDPNDWDLGGHRDVEGLNGGRARLIDWINGTNGSPKRPVGLVLLAAVEDDGPGVDEVAAADPADDPPSLIVDRVARSPEPTRRVGRVVDMADRYSVELRHLTSPDADATPAHAHETEAAGAYAVVRDDRAAARAELVELAEATSYAPFAGQATVPRLTDAWPVGARITAVEGRNLDLRGDGPGTGPPAYPRVVQLTWRAAGGQATILQLSDTRAAR